MVEGQKTPERVKRARPRRPRAPAKMKFFDKGQYERAPESPNDVDIWVGDAQLYVRLTPRLRKAVTDAANQFRSFRGPVRDSNMIREHRAKYRMDADIVVVSRKRLREHRGNKIAIHDQERDIFVLLPEDVSEWIVTEALRERQLRQAAREREKAFQAAFE